MFAGLALQYSYFAKKVNLFIAEAPIARITAMSIGDVADWLILDKLQDIVDEC